MGVPKFWSLFKIAGMLVRARSRALPTIILGHHLLSPAVLRCEGASSREAGPTLNLHLAHIRTFLDWENAKPMNSRCSRVVLPRPSQGP